MSKKSTPGDGSHGRGDKGLPGRDAHHGVMRLLLDLIRALAGGR